MTSRRCFTCWRVKWRQWPRTIIKTHECIPVGWVPSAAVAFSPATHTLPPPGMPPVNRMTDRCKNITFKQLRLWVEKIIYQDPVSLCLFIYLGKMLVDRLTQNSSSQALTLQTWTNQPSFFFRKHPVRAGLQSPIESDLILPPLNEVCLSTPGGGALCPGGGCVREIPHVPERAGGTHPTGMHSSWTGSYFKQSGWFMISRQPISWFVYWRHQEPAREGTSWCHFLSDYYWLFNSN